MQTSFIGTTFPPTSQWHKDEIDLIHNLRTQIDKNYVDQKNLLINTTWFGPQFDNGIYQQFLDTVNGQKFDNLFLLAAADPVFLNAEQIQQLKILSGAKFLFLCGHFDGPYQFNFYSFVIPKYFEPYDIDELWMYTADYVYICYNRKPRPHRIEMVRKLIDNGLQSCGIITLGKNDPVFSQSQNNDLYFTLDETPDDYAKQGNWDLPMIYGIPHDIHSLGNMDLWRRHFLHVINETEFFPWDNLFVTEKTWKPILGLRPFVINGQSTIYHWLRQQGFRTFERYWPEIDCENVHESLLHNQIVLVIQKLQQLPKEVLQGIYHDMKPDLLHNRNRFFEFSKEQYHKACHLF